MHPLLKGKDNVIKAEAKRVAHNIGELFEYQNEDELVNSFYVFSKAIVDQLDYELAVVYSKKSAKLKGEY